MSEDGLTESTISQNLEVTGAIMINEESQKLIFEFATVFIRCGAHTLQLVAGNVFKLASMQKDIDTVNYPLICENQLTLSSGLNDIIKSPVLRCNNFNPRNSCVYKSKSAMSRTYGCMFILYTTNKIKIYNYNIKHKLAFVVSDYQTLKKTNFNHLHQT